MTYTLAADIYLGDVSSQVYEFLIAPRPCIFLDAQNRHWEHDPDFAFWKFGPVVRNITELDSALHTAQLEHAALRPVQDAAFKRTFDLQAVSSATRAAAAIASFLGRQ